MYVPQEIFSSMNKTVLVYSKSKMTFLRFYGFKFYKLFFCFINFNFQVRKIYIHALLNLKTIFNANIITQNTLPNVIRLQYIVITFCILVINFKNWLNGGWSSFIVSLLQYTTKYFKSLQHLFSYFGPYMCTCI